ncbi:MAG: PIN domain nuclease [Candidatus Acidiferrales bacterium]
MLVDSSIWIDFFSSRPGPAGAELRRMIVEDEPFALTGIIVIEVLQGLKGEAAKIAHYLSLWDMLEPAGFSTYAQAASISRHARSKGVSITTIDALVAATALEHGATIFTLDRDFSRIARFTPLRLHPLTRR